MHVFERKSHVLIVVSIAVAVAAYATVEEISVALRDVYGVYEEPAF